MSCIKSRFNSELYIIFLDLRTIIVWYLKIRLSENVYYMFFIYFQYFIYMNKQSTQSKNYSFQDNVNSNEVTLSPPNSFHYKTQAKTASIENQKQKIDMGTLTDQVMCKCDCDQIAKLKEKAHKSFMQVIQIQNLYKEEIQQLQEQYEERQKTQLKKFQCKQTLLTEKCKQLEQQLEKNRQYLQKERQERVCKCKILENHILQFSTQTPFILENIQQIYPESQQLLAQHGHDDSTDTIRHLKEFIPSQNLNEQHKILQDNLQAFMSQFKQTLKKSDKGTQIKKVFGRVQKSIQQVMGLLKLLIENVVNSQQKYNRLYKSHIDIEGKYNKLIAAFQAGQKQSKFMAEHIRRISQDKINIDKKYHQIDKTNRHLQETVRLLRRNLIDRNSPNQHRKDQEPVSNINIRQSQEDISIQLNSVGPKKTSPHHQGYTKFNIQPSKGLSNFKKKHIFMQKREG